MSIKVDWGQIILVAMVIIGATLIGAWAKSPNLGIGIVLLGIAIMPFPPKR